MSEASNQSHPDALDGVDEKLAAVRRSLNRAMGTTGPIITEPKLEGIIDALGLLSEEVRRLRDAVRVSGSGQ